MLILFLVLVTLGVTNSDPYETRSKAAKAGTRSDDAYGIQSQQDPKNWDEYASNQNYQVTNPNGYSTLNFGNGSGKKNSVILNQGEDRNDQLSVGINKNNQYNLDVQGDPYNNNAGTSPCYQNGVLIQGCTEDISGGAQYPGTTNLPKTYNFGNGYNNENVVTINGGGSLDYASRDTADGSKQNIQTQQSQQDPNKLGVQNHGLNSGVQNYNDEYASNQNAQVPNQGYPVLPDNTDPSNLDGNYYAAINPNGYSTVNVGNGSGKKNSVILNQREDRNDELYVGINKNNQYNPDVQGDPYNNNAGTSPCYQKGGQNKGYPCTDDDGEAPYTGTSNRPKTYNIGNGHNNENVVTINGGGRGILGSRGSAGGSKPNKQAYDISARQQPSRANGGFDSNYYNIGYGQRNDNYFSWLW